MKRFAFIFLFACANIFVATAQETKDSAHIVLSGYIDAYWASYTDSVGPDKFQRFPTISPRSNQFGLNTAQVTAQYDGEKVRGVVTLHYGDIAQSAWSQTYNAIQEAHAGIRLSKKWWFDGGFFRTHIGTEGLLPKENIASSVAVVSWHEPYYQAGFRLNFNPNDKLAFSLYLLNGYNIFQDNNDKKSLGLLVTYALGDKGNIGYSNYIGDDSPQGDSVSHSRIHQNLFFNYQISPKFKLQVGGDVCIQQNSKITDPTKPGTMSGSVLSLKYNCCKKGYLYIRGESFNDPDGFMSGAFVDDAGKSTGIVLSGVTLGAEYKPTESSYIRLEGRRLAADKDQLIFYWDKKITNVRNEVMLNFGISF